GIRDFHVTGVQTCALPIYLFAALSFQGGLRSTLFFPPYSLQPTARRSHRLHSAQELTSPFFSRIAEELLGRACFHDLAAIHEYDTISKLSGKCHLVRHEQHAHGRR